MGQALQFYAVVDDRNICPEQWKVPSDLDWQVLETALGMDESELSVMGYYRGQSQEVGSKLKSSQFDFFPWDGSNDTGFSGVPSGIRSQLGTYTNASTSNQWWTTDLYAPTAGLFRGLIGVNTGVMRFSSPINTGASVRCLKE